MSKLKLLKNLVIASGGFFVAGMLYEISSRVTSSFDTNSSDNISLSSLSTTLFGMSFVTIIPTIPISLDLLSGSYRDQVEQEAAMEMYGYEMTSLGRTMMSNHENATGHNE